MNNTLWDTAFIHDSHFSYLATKLANPKGERWGFIVDEQKKPLPVLQNYIEHTYRRLYQLNEAQPAGNYLYLDDDNICFNTGLYTSNYEKIYALLKQNNPNYRQAWRMNGFYPASARELSFIPRLPERATYFQDISEVFYDTKCDLRIRVDHILDDEENRMRIPEDYRNNKMLPMLLGTMAVEFAKMRIEENYKTAVPQFFQDKIQFLIPICLHDPSVVDLALAVSREGNTYTGRTCLTLDMAYNNARLIAKPESEWL